MYMYCIMRGLRPLSSQLMMKSRLRQKKKIKMMMIAADQSGVYVCVVEAFGVVSVFTASVSAVSQTQLCP